MQQKEYLLSLLGNKRLVTTLLYRGSDHGWYAYDFQSRSNYKGPTIILFKIKDGDCVGGYTTAQREPSLMFVDDSDAMLFNLSCRRHFPNKGKGGEILCSQIEGPWFGNNELIAFGEPFNGEECCESQANEECYGIPMVDGKNMLTNKEGIYITITELEVWEVKQMKE